MPKQVTSTKDLAPGDYYEDCCFHPCLCTEVNASEGELKISGISLVDGSNPRGCTVPGCAVRKLTLEEALLWKFYGPTDQKLDEKDRWWLPANQTWAPSWLQPTFKHSSANHKSSAE